MAHRKLTLTTAEVLTADTVKLSNIKPDAKLKELSFDFIVCDSSDVVLRRGGGLIEAADYDTLMDGSNTDTQIQNACLQKLIDDSIVGAGTKQNV